MLENKSKSLAKVCEFTASSVPIDCWQLACVWSLKKRVKVKSVV